jgi:hypothetical protein
MKICRICKGNIPEGRLKALPDTDTCVNCSKEEKVAGFRVISGKTSYTELELVSQKKFKELTRKQARVGQSPGKGLWMNERNSKTLKL